MTQSSVPREEGLDEIRGGCDRHSSVSSSSYDMYPPPHMTCILLLIGWMRGTLVCTHFTCLIHLFQNPQCAFRHCARAGRGVSEFMVRRDFSVSLFSILAPRLLPAGPISARFGYCYPLHMATTKTFPYQIRKSTPSHRASGNVKDGKLLAKSDSLQQTSGRQNITNPCSTADQDGEACIRGLVPAHAQRG